MRREGISAHRRKTPILTKILGMAMAAIWLLPSMAAAAGGGKPATKVYNVADTRTMAPGISKFIADLYNGDSFIFGLVVVVIMAGLGLILGYGMDFFVKKIGIDLGKLSHHE